MCGEVCRMVYGHGLCGLTVVAELTRSPTHHVVPTRRLREPLAVISGSVLCGAGLSCSAAQGGLQRPADGAEAVGPCSYTRGGAAGQAARRETPPAESDLPGRLAHHATRASSGVGVGGSGVADLIISSNTKACQRSTLIHKALQH